MKLIPIDVDGSQKDRFRDNPECLVIMEIFAGQYEKVGFHKPWIAYFVSDDANENCG